MCVNKEISALTVVPARVLLLRELWRNLWKEQAVLRWKEEVSQHGYNNCTELCLPRTSKSLSHHFCTWSRTQLRLPGNLLRCGTFLCSKKEFMTARLLSLLFLTWFFLSPLLTGSMTLDLSAPLENPKVKTRRRRAIISCMPEPLQETNSTTTSSPFVASATSARCWRRREATVLLVWVRFSLFFFFAFLLKLPRGL